MLSEMPAISDTQPRLIIADNGSTYNIIRNFIKRDAASKYVESRLDDLALEDGQRVLMIDVDSDLIGGRDRSEWAEVLSHIDANTKIVYLTEKHYPKLNDVIDALRELDVEPMLCTNTDNWVTIGQFIEWLTEGVDDKSIATIGSYRFVGKLFLGPWLFGRHNKNNDLIFMQTSDNSASAVKAIVSCLSRSVINPEARIDIRTHYCDSPMYLSGVHTYMPASPTNDEYGVISFNGITPSEFVDKWLEEQKHKSTVEL